MVGGTTTRCKSGVDMESDKAYSLDRGVDNRERRGVDAGGGDAVGGCGGEPSCWGGGVLERGVDQRVRGVDVVDIAGSATGCTFGGVVVSNGGGGGGRPVVVEAVALAMEEPSDGGDGVDADE